MNKPIIVLLLLAAAWMPAAAKARRYKGHVMQCISGNCVNGSGTAIVTMNSDYEGDEGNQLHYTGTFRDGLMDGEGTAYSVKSSTYIEGERQTIYSGQFADGDKDGYAVVFEAKYRGNEPVPDSSGVVKFMLYERGQPKRVVSIGIDGMPKAYFFKKYSADEVPLASLHDDWLSSHTNAYLASRNGKFAAVGTPTATPVILFIKSFGVAQGSSVTFTEWDCLTDRKYFVVAASQMPNKQMPFGGNVYCQVLNEAGAVVFEALNGTYWTPPKAGHYTFLVKYTQSFTGNGVNLRVDALPLKCTLQSRSL